MEKVKTIKSEKYYDTLIIGTGCAGFNAADWLYDLGRHDIAILTEGVNMGTSRNTGSDKQTYYKLSIASDGDDSVAEMAETLFSGGSVHGDTALVEAACSIKAFMKLVLLGVLFPTNEYGEYVGYKTDHDPRQRATSCGPLTSKLMTEALEKSVNKKGIAIFDKTQVIQLLTDNNKIIGVLTVDTGTGEYRSFACNNVILATGGPAGVYSDSVFPKSQTGASGLAINAGAAMINLCEWQYGLASLKFRWNVSGTYQQVLPRYISIDSSGREREFLQEAFKDPAEAMDMVFLKGYQWPFDVRKIEGSSRVDMLVYKETQLGNKVYMDFRVNPTGLDYNSLSKETREYLKNSDATFGTPIERLEKMNPLAVKLYKDNGIDLHTEPLEVAVCAQHCNGGVAVDTNWESTVDGLYAAGEAAGTFGVYRPGGSALNSAQVGSMRAAQHISLKPTGPEKTISTEIKEVNISPTDGIDIADILEKTRKAMSADAAFMRDTDKMSKLLNEINSTKEELCNSTVFKSPAGLTLYYSCLDTLTTQAFMLSSMLYAADAFGSRGSCLVSGKNPENSGVQDTVVITDSAGSHAEKVRPKPDGGGWFETVWNEFNKKRAKEF